MWRTPTILVAVLAVSCMARHVHATTQVYFVATTGIVAPGGQGAPGAVLRLQEGGGPWTIEMRVDTSVHLAAWGLDLVSDNGAAAGLAASNLLMNVNVWVFPIWGVAGPAPNLLIGAGAIDVSPPYPSPGDQWFLSFNLTGGAAGNIVRGVVNINEWIDGDIDDYDPDTRFGADSGNPGSLGRQTGPLIELEPNCVPPGDVNCDCRVDLADIQPFVLSMVRPSAFGQAYPNCKLSKADINGDGRVNGLDIRAFVSSIRGG